MVFKVKYAKSKPAGNIAMRNRNILKHKGRNWSKAVFNSTLEADKHIINYQKNLRPKILSAKYETLLITAMKKRNVPKTIRKKLVLPTKKAGFKR